MLSSLIKLINECIDEIENDPYLTTEMRKELLVGVWDLKRALSIPPSAFSMYPRQGG